ncbi:MAG: hypothetical protein IH986_03860 [Planctomycetes bacterium]|nr:hypothetical protein [Planctomycetota bacterium]
MIFRSVLRSSAFGHGRSFSRALLVAAALLLFVAHAAAQTRFRTVFVVNNVSDEISVLRVRPDGTLQRLGDYATSDWPTPISVAPDGRHLAVTHATAASTELLQIFAVAADGSLSLAASLLIPDAPLGLTWLPNSKLAATNSNAGGPNFVHTYDFDEVAGSITPIDRYDTGSFNTNLVFWPGAWILYAQDSFANRIRWFGVNADGTLEFIGSAGSGAVFPLEVGIVDRGGAGGSFLYSACGISGDRHRVLGYQMGFATGQLNPLTASPFFSPGLSPAHVAASTDKRWLFVGHGTDATVHSFAIGTAGELTPTGFSFDVGLQGTLGDVAVLDRLLIMTDESTAIDGIKGVYSFLINSNGSFTQLAPILDLGQRPESIAVWDPGIVLGDLNCDGQLNGGDIDPFFTALGDPPAYVLANPGCNVNNADVNQDGAINGADIDVFFRLLGGG